MTSRAGNPRKLKRAQTVYRLGDVSGQYPVFSPEGARRTEGRWNYAGDLVIYTAVHYSTAMLEKLVYLNHVVPPNMHFVEVTIPSGVSYEVVDSNRLPNWYAKNGREAREFGHEWYVERRSAILFVPSVVARMEPNVIINSTHPEFEKISDALEVPIWWDDRLFAPDAPDDVT